MPTKIWVRTKNVLPFTPLYAIIDWATLGPIPGSFCNASSDAVSTSISFVRSMMSNYIFSLIMSKETELITISITRYKKKILNQRTQFSHTKNNLIF